ncbi:MAG: hypothetical protein ACOC6P_04345 [Candidatus Aminicenantaceae bacterium]
MFDFCEQNDIKYDLGFKPLSPLQKEIKPFLQEVAMNIELEVQPVRMITEALYKAKS